MRNELRALSDWRRRALERARARGGVHLFWFYMSLGLAWSLLMFGSTLLVDIYYRRAFDAEDLQTRALIYFVGGLLFGLGIWVVRETTGAGRADDRR
ncbi:MAG TPA: hypothetical protein VF297_05715 [Pyrinomonadaceae bacterium]